MTREEEKRKQMNNKSNNKFYEFKNKTDTNIDIYVYGEIVGGSDKWDSSDVTFTDFKDALDGLKGTETVNMYINSGGGNVFTTQSIASMIQRAQEKGVVVNAFLDGLCASCASFLPLVADNVYTYKSSIMMVHSPFTFAFGNAIDMRSQADVLDKIEDSVMMPIYMSKAKEGITEDYIKDIVSKETWLNAEEMSNIFDITILEDSRELVACINDKSVLDNYKNIPDAVKSQLSKVSTAKVVEDKTKDEIKIEIEDTKKLELLKAKLNLELL